MSEIDVVMPVKDAAETLSSAAYSILGQTLSDIRLIIVADGSGAPTRDVMDRLQSDSRVVVYENDGSGIVSALNYGISKSEAPLIARMDADDISLPERLSRQRSFMLANPDCVVCGTGVIRFGGDVSQPQLPLQATECAAALDLYNPLYHPTVVLRREALLKHGIRYRQDYIYAEDYKLFAELSAVGEVRNVSEPLLLYRSHVGQVSHLRRKQQDTTAFRIALERLNVRHPQRSRVMAYASLLLLATRVEPRYRRRAANALLNYGRTLLVSTGG